MGNDTLLAARCPLPAFLRCYWQQGQTLGIVLKYYLLKGKGRARGRARSEDGSSKMPSGLNCPDE